MEGSDLMWQSWVQLVAGVWIFLAPFLLGYTGAARTNDLILGLIVAVVAAITLFRKPKEK